MKPGVYMSAYGVYMRAYGVYRLVVVALLLHSLSFFWTKLIL